MQNYSKIKNTRILFLWITSDDDQTADDDDDDESHAMMIILWDFQQIAKLHLWKMKIKFTPIISHTTHVASWTKRTCWCYWCSNACEHEFVIDEFIISAEHIAAKNEFWTFNKKQKWSMFRRNKFSILFLSLLRLLHAAKYSRAKN
jgi:hypothetical protein